MANDILIVDDEADIRDLVAGILDDEGFTTRTARDSDSALAEIANRRPHLVFLDIWLQGSKLDGLQLLEQIKREQPDLPVGLERLLDEVVGAALDGGDRGFDIAVSGDHHDRQIGLFALDLLQQLQAIELAALQPDVEKYQMRAAVGDLRQRRIAVARGPGGESLVIDNQNVTCHGSRLSCQLPLAASIFVSLLVASDVPSGLVASGGPAVSVTGTFVSPSGAFAFAFAAWPDTACL